MFPCLLALLAVSADPAQPAAPNPVKWPVAEKIVAEFQKGIPPNHPRKRGGTSGHVGHNRIWTVKALKDTFGEPQTLNDDRTEWTWKRADGAARVIFASKGYGGSTEPELLRLQIQSAHFQPAKPNPAPNP